MVWPQILLTVVAIVVLVGVLAYFLDRLARQLHGVSTTLAKITFGVRAVETQCSAIGPAVERINENLLQAAGGITAAAKRAEHLAKVQTHRGSRSDGRLKP